jgi:hypothetical protein
MTDYIEIIRDISLLIGIWVAIHGLNSWRREHTGKRRLELAEDALAMFYEARDAIHHIRYPMSNSHETEDVEKRDGETETQWDARKNASVVFKRYKKYQELFGKIRAMRYRFMAQFGPQAAKPFDDLQGIVSKVIVSARTLARLWPRNQFTTDEKWQRHLDAIERNEAVFWEGTADEDPINPQLDSIITDIEQTCSGVISGDDSLASILNRPLFRRTKWHLFGKKVQ